MYAMVHVLTLESNLSGDSPLTMQVLGIELTSLIQVWWQASLLSKQYL